MAIFVFQRILVSTTGHHGVVVHKHVKVLENVIGNVLDYFVMAMLKKLRTVELLNVQVSLGDTLLKQDILHEKKKLLLYL